MSASSVSIATFAGIGVLLIGFTTSAQARSPQDTPGAQRAAGPSEPPNTELSTELRLELPTDTLSPQGDLGWHVVLPAAWQLRAAGVDGRRRSPVRLFEDGSALRPGDAPHRVVREEGGGAFSHYGDGLWFSTSDGSDPRTNGRRYLAVLPDDRDLPPVVVAPPIEVLETLPPPTWVSPALGAAVGLRPELRARHEDQDVLFQWELDVRPDFGSRNLLRWPRLVLGPDGPHPLSVLDENWDGRGRFTPPCRLSALVLPERPGPDELTRQAWRLVAGLDDDEARVREVLAWVTSQIHPHDDDARRLPADEVFCRDRGNCGSMVGLAAELLRTVGYPVRFLDLAVPRIVETGDRGGRHTAMEVGWSGRWHYADPFFGRLLEDWDASELARPAIEPEVLFEMAPAGVLADRDRSFRTLTVGDYCGSVGYRAQLEGEVFRGADVAGLAPPPLLEGLMPPVPPRELWGGDRVTIHARVRVLAARSAEIHRPSRRWAGAPPMKVHVSPWVTTSFAVDLSTLRPGVVDFFGEGGRTAYVEAVRDRMDDLGDAADDFFEVFLLDQWQAVAYELGVRLPFFDPAFMKSPKIHLGQGFVIHPKQLLDDTWTIYRNRLEPEDIERLFEPGYSPRKWLVAPKGPPFVRFLTDDDGLVETLPDPAAAQGAWVLIGSGDRLMSVSLQYGICVRIPLDYSLPFDRDAPPRRTTYYGAGGQTGFVVSLRGDLERLGVASRAPERVLLETWRKFCLGLGLYFPPAFWNIDPTTMHLGHGFHIHASQLEGDEWRVERDITNRTDDPEAFDREAGRGDDQTWLVVPKGPAFVCYLTPEGIVETLPDEAEGHDVWVLFGAGDWLMSVSLEDVRCTRVPVALTQPFEER